MILMESDRVGSKGKGKKGIEKEKRGKEIRGSFITVCSAKLLNLVEPSVLDSLVSRFVRNQATELFGRGWFVCTSCISPIKACYNVSFNATC